MTEREALKLALDALQNKFLFIAGDGEAIDQRAKAITAIKEALAQPEQETPKGWKSEIWKSVKQQEQEPVAMKFKIYKPTVPDPTRQGINNALLPWVYDQDRNSGFDATMWVTPVSTLPPQRKPLMDAELERLYDTHAKYQEYGAWVSGWFEFARAIEAAHGIKGEA